MSGTQSHAREVLKAYVVGQVELGYATFDPGPRSTDLMLVSYPKSGSTWTSYLLHQVRSEGDDDFAELKEQVVDITPGHWDPRKNPFLPEQAFHPRTYKTHGSYELAPKGGRLIYLARDPADTLWSLYWFVHDVFALEDPMPIEKFYTDYFVARFDTGHDIGNPWSHFLSWHPHREDENLLWLHYEDLREDLPRCLARIAAHMGVDLKDDLLELVLARSSMEHMRSLAAKLNPSPTNPVGRLTTKFSPLTRNYGVKMRFGKMRKGVVGDGARSLPESLRLAVDDEWRQRIAPKLGYATYREMRERCSLLA